MDINWGNLFHTAKKPKNYAGAMIVALAFAFGLGLYAFRGAIWPQARPSSVVPPVSASETFRHPLTGMLSDTEVEKPQVQAVMIDHSVDAWPQSGVDKAFLVIEAPVEAGIPRLEAFFYEGQNVLKIGPVRSARPYFVDFANEFGAEYGHVGGSDEALALIQSSGTFDLNQFSHGDDYWRSTDRLAPHNAYTSTDLLDKALKAAANLPTPSYGAWTFKDPEVDVQQGPGVTVDFSVPAYKAVWTHDAATNTYARTQNGAKYVMQDGGKIAASNVAVMVSDVSVVDAVGRKHIRTTGEGEAWVLQDGKVIQGTWKKPSVAERLRFFDADGKEIAMNAGNTWIEIIGDAKSVTINQPK